MVTQQVAPSIKKKKKTFVRPCRQIEGQNSFLSLPLVFHKFPIGLPTFFLVSIFGCSWIIVWNSQPLLQALNGCVLTRPNKWVMPNSDWFLYTFVKQILEIGLIILFASIYKYCMFYDIFSSSYLQVLQSFAVSTVD